jgi:hypothetical protein
MNLNIFDYIPVTYHLNKEEESYLEFKAYYESL